MAISSSRNFTENRVDAQRRSAMTVLFGNPASTAAMLVTRNGRSLRAARLHVAVGSRQPRSKCLLDRTPSKGIVRLDPKPVRHRDGVILVRKPG